MSDIAPPAPPIEITGDRILLLDQTLLPAEERWIEIESVEQMWDAIKILRIRGAPAIGIAAAYGMVIASRGATAASRDEFLADLETARSYLASSRPTAVNLFWALNRVMKAVEQTESDSVHVLRRVVRKEADDIYREDVEAGRKIGEFGAELLGAGGSVLTHCNAGGIATSGYGTALAPMYILNERGEQIHVFVDETRPLLQGSRLTAWELDRAGIDATLITDSMAASVLASGKVKAVIVGSDRVAANGDVANKIGTLGVAMLAHGFDIPFYVAIPVSTIDFEIETGADIPIEERQRDEIASINNVALTPDRVAVYNPAFDVTPARYVTAFITEHGIIKPPFKENLGRLQNLSV